MRKVTRDTRSRNLRRVHNSHACDLQHATLTSHDCYFTATGVFSYCYTSLFLPLTNYFVLGLKSTKVKLSANPTRLTAIKESDELSSMSSSDLSESDNNCGKSKSNDSNGEGSNVDNEDEDFGMTRMTEGEAWQMFDDEVTSSIFNIHPTSCADSSLRCPRIQPPFSMMMMMTLKWPVSSLISAVDMGPVQKLRIPPCPNQREYLTSMRTTRTTMNSQPTFQPLPKSLSSQR